VVFVLSVDTDSVFWKNGRFDQDAVCGGGSGGPKQRCIRWGETFPTGRGNFCGGNGVTNCNV